MTVVKHEKRPWRDGLRLAVLLIVELGRGTGAHEPGLSSAAVQVLPDKLEAQLTFALRDADALAGLDTDRDGVVAEEEFVAAEERLGRLVAHGFEVHFDDVPAPATKIRCQFDEDNNNADVYLTIPGKTFSKLTMRSKTIADLGLDHRQYFLLLNASGVMIAERLLSANADTVTIEVEPSATDAPAESTTDSSAPGAPNTGPGTTTRRDSTFGQFLALGVEHILMGYDHLLFLLALLIVTRDWLSSLKVITCFTVAHSITLAVATLDLVQVPARWVEPLIAVTIIYVGVENILRHGEPRGRWLLTFAFGLIHGFGFAAVLREMGVASRPGGVATPLFAFNLGVEVGQVLVAALVLPIFWRLRASPVFVRRLIPACSVVVAVAGAVWLVQRVWPG